MNEVIIILGTLLGCIISYFTINKFVFYTKAEVDTQIKNLKEASDLSDTTINTKMEKLHSQTNRDLSETKEKIYEKLLEAERQANKDRQALYDKLSANKQIFEDYNKNMLSAIAEIKQGEKETNSDFLQMVNTVKDELKNDYINRYNDLLKVIGTKANAADFDRLENKFDKVTETITELKTIVEMTIEKTNNKK